MASAQALAIPSNEIARLSCRYTHTKKKKNVTTTATKNSDVGVRGRSSDPKKLDPPPKRRIQLTQVHYQNMARDVTNGKRAEIKRTRQAILWLILAHAKKKKKSWRQWLQKTG